MFFTCFFFFMCSTCHITLISHCPPFPFSSSYLVPGTLLSDSPPLCHSPFLLAIHRCTKSCEKSLHPAQSHTEGKTSQELNQHYIVLFHFSLQQKKKDKDRSFQKHERKYFSSRGTCRAGVRVVSGVALIMRSTQTLTTLAQWLSMLVTHQKYPGLMQDGA